jgi:DnaJ-class molecular chaperone
MEKRIIGQKIKPEKYGMILCPYCNGAGKCSSDSKGVEVCKACGGFGVIKKEKQVVQVITG